MGNSDPEEPSDFSTAAQLGVKGEFRVPNKYSFHSRMVLSLQRTGLIT